MDDVCRRIYGAMLAVLLVGFAPMKANAKLEFEKTLAEHHAKAEDDAFKVLFPFVNRGDREVRIVKVESSCGCLKAETDKQVLKPGESGVITGVFNLGAATGPNEKMLTIKTDEGGEAYRLVTRIIVPEVVSIEPKILSWEMGAEAEAKDFLVTIKHDAPVRVVEVVSSRAEFTCEVEAVEEGRQYRITLKPESTEKPLLGVLRIETDCEIEKHRRHMAFFSVKRKAAE